MRSIRLGEKIWCFCLVYFLSLAWTQALSRLPYGRRFFARNLYLPQRFMPIIFQELGNFRLLLFPERFHLIELQVRVLFGWLWVLQYAIVGNLVHLKPDVWLAGNLLLEDLLFQQYILMTLVVYIFYLDLSARALFQNGFEHAGLSINRQRDRQLHFVNIQSIQQCDGQHFFLSFAWVLLLGTFLFAYFNTHQSQLFQHFIDISFRKIQVVDQFRVVLRVEIVCSYDINQPFSYCLGNVHILFTSSVTLNFLSFTIQSIESRVLLHQTSPQNLQTQNYSQQKHMFCIQTQQQKQRLIEQLIISFFVIYLLQFVSLFSSINLQTRRFSQGQDTCQSIRKFYSY